MVARGDLGEGEGVVGGWERDVRGVTGRLFGCHYLLR